MTHTCFFCIDFFFLSKIASTLFCSQIFVINSNGTRPRDVVEHTNSKTNRRSLPKERGGIFAEKFLDKPRGIVVVDVGLFFRVSTHETCHAVK